ncbi:Uncharacterised protein at_DN1186 [Pycnogonum litorale]
MCKRCGKVPGHSRDNCPASKAKCHKCSKIGHYSSVCLSSQQIDTVDTISFLGSVETSCDNKPWKTDIVLNQNKTVRFKIDCGADVTAISHSSCPDLQLQPSDRILYGPERHKLNTLGMFAATLQRKDKVIR